MPSQITEREGYAEVCHPEYLPNGGVYWVRIELHQQDDGVLFVSPIDQMEHLVKGITIDTLDTEWWQEDHASDILDGIASMGGCRWILGNFTEYDLVEDDGKYYYEVTEVIRGDIDDFLKQMREEVNA